AQFFVSAAQAQRQNTDLAIKIVKCIETTDGIDIFFRYKTTDVDGSLTEKTARLHNKAASCADVQALASTLMPSQTAGASTDFAAASAGGVMSLLGLAYVIFALSASSESERRFSYLIRNGRLVLGELVHAYRSAGSARTK